MGHRHLRSAAVALLLTGAIHGDWHLARPAHHRLSLGISWHWMLAAPLFALAAWYVTRLWPTHVRRASIAIVGSATIAAGVIEPAVEYFVMHAPRDWAFGAARFTALAAFVGTGLIAYALTLAGIARGRDSSPAGSSAATEIRHVSQ